MFLHVVVHEDRSVELDFKWSIVGSQAEMEEPDQAFQRWNVKF